MTRAMRPLTWAVCALAMLWAAPTFAAPAAAPPATPSAKSESPAASKPKSRRVLIFGTTIVGDVLKPTFERTVPWQNPPAFRSDAPPLMHDFTKELLEPLDRRQVVPQKELDH